MASMPAFSPQQAVVWRVRGLTSSRPGWLGGTFETVALPLLTILVASWQVTLRSDDENAVVRPRTQNLFDGRGGDLNQ